MESDKPADKNGNMPVAHSNAVKTMSHSTTLIYSMICPMDAASILAF